MPASAPPAQAGHGHHAAAPGHLHRASVRQQRGNIPEFCALFRDLALVTASSAAAERVFSLYNNTFGDQQDNAKEDYIEASMMAQYRQREPNWGNAE